jgi:hypothetical protein
MMMSADDASAARESMMKPQPIETAPRDGTPILAYGSYGWESLERHATTGWLVVQWEPELTYGDDCNPIGGWKSITANPYKDYMHATLWVPLPAPE